jgi:ABC-2 type transport system ATP-binding protein
MLYNTPSTAYRTLLYRSRGQRTEDTIILTTHYLDEAESLCRNIAIINHGEVVENTSMKNLLSQLHTEVFVLDLKESLASVPEIDGIAVTQRDEFTLEVAVDKSRSLNFLFEKLDEHGIRVMSMRNKSNRLEELFMTLVEDDNTEKQAHKPLQMQGKKQEAGA